MKRSMRCSDQKRRRFLGGRRSREARKSAGTSTESARAKRSSQEPGLRESMTSPVSGSLRMKTSREVKRKSEGKRTAWLRPFLKSLAILRMAALPWGFRARRALDICHGISQGFLKQTAEGSMRMEKHQ